jgi:hypothetical protein
MRNHSHVIVATLALAGFALLAGGCEREIAHTEETKIKDDGTVKTKEKTVTEGTDGDTTVTEKETTRKPGDPD